MIQLSDSCSHNIEVLAGGSGASTPITKSHTTKCTSIFVAAVKHIIEQLIYGTTRPHANITHGGTHSKCDQVSQKVLIDGTGTIRFNQAATSGPSERAFCWLFFPI